VVPPDDAASAATLLPFLDPAAGLPRGSPAVSACVEAAATFLRGAGLAVQEAPMVASCARSRDPVPIRHWAPEANALSMAAYRERQVQRQRQGNALSTAAYRERQVQRQGQGTNRLTVHRPNIRSFEYGCVQRSAHF
jgi:hypothetical protein